jgi:hypothetical protein
MTNTTETNPKLAKIKALMNKANNAGCTDAEASAFRAKVFEMMMREGFTEKDLREVDSTKFISKSVKLLSTTWREDIHLAMSCGDSVGIMTLMKAYDANRGGAYAVFRGPANLIEQAELAFIMLLAQCKTASRKRPKNESQRSFHAGFAAAVKRNVASALKDVEADMPGTGLVLLSLYEQIRDSVGKTRQSNTRSANAGAAGYRAGMTADTNMRQRVAASGRIAIG